MFFTDTHVHFDEAAASTAATLQRALAAGVTRLVAVGGSPELNAAAAAAAKAFPQTIRLALGLDRDHTGLDAENYAPPADAPLCAIGEAGLDYHHHPSAATRAAQQRLFAAMLRLAATRQLPIIVHTRAADDDTLRILDESGDRALAAAGRLGVAHCFTGDAAFARALLARGLHISFSGILTFRNAAALRAVAREIPDERLLIETDAPYLAPEPLRGQRNEPAFVRRVAECLAETRGLSLEALADLTSRNAARLFGPWPAAQAGAL